MSLNSTPFVLFYVPNHIAYLGNSLGSGVQLALSSVWILALQHTCIISVFYIQPAIAHPASLLLTLHTANDSTALVDWGRGKMVDALTGRSSQTNLQPLV